ncbi:MAG: carboxypeptidase-like regulatory domain-containing protein, partial [Candidatus Saccharimonadales bacterium]
MHKDGIFKPRHIKNMKKNPFGVLVMLSRYFLIGFLIQTIAFNTLFGKSGEAQLNVPIHTVLQNVSVGQVFNVVKARTGYTFVYDAAEINCNRKVDIPGTNLNAKDVLDALSSTLDLSFKKIGNSITVRKNSPPNSKAAKYVLPYLTNTVLKISNYIPYHRTAGLPVFSVSGVVRDDKGNPLIGVSVHVKNSNRGTVTDSKGYYALKTPQNSILVFSYVGYET